MFLTLMAIQFWTWKTLDLAQLEDCQLVKWEVVSSNLYQANAQIRHITKEKVLPWPLEMRLC